MPPPRARAVSHLSFSQAAISIEALRYGIQSVVCPSSVNQSKVRDIRRHGKAMMGQKCNTRVAATNLGRDEHRVGTRGVSMYSFGPGFRVTSCSRESSIDPERDIVKICTGRPGSSEVPRNPLTRWDVSSIPANGIFRTKKLKNKIKMPNGWRTIKSLVHKIRLSSRRGKGMAESFSRKKLRHVPQKEGG